MNEEKGKKDGFRDEKYYILPTELFSSYVGHPLIRPLYPTDLGYFPKALGHYREREEGAEETILLYCIDGCGIVEVENRTFDLHPHQAFCLPPGKHHRYYADSRTPWTIFWIHFKGEAAVLYPPEEETVIEIHSEPSQNRIQTLFQMLFRVMDRNYTLGNFIYISQMTSTILSEIYFREKTDTNTPYDHHVTTVIRYMYQNLERTLTLQEISEEVRLSKSYLNSIFKSQTGHAPVDFFIRLKMQEACKLLKESTLYIYEVSIRVGYKDPYYFSRIFKKIVGVSPKEYASGEYFYQL